MHRFQLSIFGAIAIVFAVDGVNQGIFSGFSSLDAMAAGWLILAIVDILWVLYFTSEEDSLALYLFNSLGTGGLSPPGRRRRAGRGQSVHMGGTNGYTGSYAGGGIGPGDIPYDTKVGGMGGMGARSQASLGPVSGGAGSVGNMGGGARSIGGGGAGSISGAQSTGPMSGDNMAVSSPLMGSGNAGVGAGGGLASPERETPISAPTETYSYKAKALYACASWLLCSWLLPSLFR